MRGEIQRMIDKGMDRPAIIAIYRTKYGEKILSAPTTEGFNLLAWVMPFFARRGRRRTHRDGARQMANTPRPPAPAPLEQRVPAIDPKLRERLDAEVKDKL